MITVIRCCDECRKPLEISEKWLSLGFVKNRPIVCLDCERKLQVKAIQEMSKMSKGK